MDVLLIRGLVGVWPLIRGCVRSRTRPRSMDVEERGRFGGYMPQAFELFRHRGGSENIALSIHSRTTTLLCSGAGGGRHDRFPTPYGIRRASRRGSPWRPAPGIALARALMAIHSCSLYEPIPTSTPRERALTRRQGVRARGGTRPRGVAPCVWPRSICSRDGGMSALRARDVSMKQGQKGTVVPP